MIVLVIVGAVAFYGGMKYGQGSGLQANAAQNSGQNNRNFPGGQNGNGGNAAFARRGGAGGNGVSGEILNSDDKSITVKIPTGGSKIVFYSSTTKIMKSVDVAVADLTAGENVMVAGTANTDGSLTASMIQIRPVMPTGTNPANPGATPANT